VSSARDSYSSDGTQYLFAVVVAAVVVVVIIVIAYLA